MKLATDHDVKIFAIEHAAGMCADLIDWAAPSLRRRSGGDPRQAHSANVNDTHPLAEVTAYCLAAANAEWGFPLTVIKFVVLRYRVGQMMGAHRDRDGGAPPGLKRYAAASVQLSHDHEYDGGNLICAGEPAPRELGTVICFDADTLHEVTRVNAGVRWSLVGWAYGPR